jgi:hypothetical protein
MEIKNEEKNATRHKRKTIPEHKLKTRYKWGEKLILSGISVKRGIGSSEFANNRTFHNKPPMQKYFCSTNTSTRLWDVVIV